jgi:hypothetical protein
MKRIKAKGLKSALIRFIPGCLLAGLASVTPAPAQADGPVMMVKPPEPAAAGIPERSHHLWPHDQRHLHINCNRHVRRAGLAGKTAVRRYPP